MTGATGAFAGDCGRPVLAVLGRPPGGGPGTPVPTHLTIALVWAGSPNTPPARGWIRATPQPSRKRIPDSGIQVALAGRVRLGSEGKLALTGTATGTGFERVGRFALHLSLSSARGTVTIDAFSRLERGFSGPF